MGRQLHTQVHHHETCSNGDKNKRPQGLQYGLSNYLSAIISQFSFLIQANWTRLYFVVVFSVVFTFSQASTPQFHTYLISTF